MARRRDIEITIAPNGQIEVHVKGMPGKQCLKVRDMLAGLVGRAHSEQHTGEYYQSEEVVSLEQRRV